MPYRIRQAAVDLDDTEGFFSRVLTKLNSLWVGATFPFAGKGRKLSLHYASDISRRLARHIQLGNRVEIGRYTWLSAGSEDNHEINITIGDDCHIGARCTISAKNSIHLERDVYLEPDVLIIDNNHAYEDVATPIAQQGTTEGGTIEIEEGCRIGTGVAIVCEKGELILGRNSIVAPRSVVTRSFPPHSVLSGNPARIVHGSGAEKPNSQTAPLNAPNGVSGVEKSLTTDTDSADSKSATMTTESDIPDSSWHQGLVGYVHRATGEPDPMSWISRFASKLRTLWLAHTYPFASFGKGAWAHYSCQVVRSGASYISIAERVGLAHGVRLEVSAARATDSPVLIMEAGSGLQRRGRISARNHIHIMKEAIFGFSVRIMDHSPELRENGPSTPEQARTGGTIRIEDECWIGFGALIVCEEGELVIGRHSVVGANCVITHSIPAYSVVAGDPARIVKQYDFSKGEWVLGCVRPLGADRKPPISAGMVCPRTGAKTESE